MRAAVKRSARKATPKGYVLKPPVAPVDGEIAGSADRPPAVSVCPKPRPKPRIETLRQRADFLRAARAGRQGTKGMMVQALRRDDGTQTIRVGFTCSKKVGNAVARNRAKRRLREVARLEIPQIGQPGWDYVLIGRAEATADRPFDAMRDDLRYALKKLHQS